MANKRPLVVASGGVREIATSDTVLADAIAIDPAANDAILLLDEPEGTYGATVRATRNGTLRWQMVMGTSDAETGSNAGSDFAIHRYGDSGTVIDTPIAITRSSGEVEIPNQLNVGGVLLRAGGNSLNTSNYVVSGSTSFNNVVQVNANGSTGIISYQHVPGVAALMQFQVNGQANFSFKNNGHGECAGAWDVVSDERLKTNLKPVENALDKIDLVEVVTYERIDAPTSMTGPALPVRYVGILAQQLQRALPEAVSVSPTEEMSDRLTVASDGAGLLALAAVKNLKAQNTELRALIEHLTARLDALTSST